MAKKVRAPASDPETGYKRPTRKEPGEKAAWRSGIDFIVMLGIALCIALLIKGYVFDVYLIPSGSMETALHGRPDGGDRIFCSKFHYRFNPPQRWEVAVFDFPYETARANDPENSSEQYKGQNFVKRIVGLPGETLAIGRGDIWTRPFRDNRGGFTRMVKPDSAQRGMWLNVYERNFSDLDREELNRFWKVMGDATLERGGPLRLADGVRLDYRPLVPAGQRREEMVELPGIPDRYVLRQPVQFRCREKTAGGADCGREFVATVWTQNVEARCPACGKLVDETSAIFYHRRSGLAAAGRYRVNPAYAPQGEDARPRQEDYHIVPDLRVLADFSLSSGDAAFGVALREDNRFVQALVHGNGQIEFLVNGQPSTPKQRGLADITPGRFHRLEFYIVDGTARLFVDSAARPVLDVAIWGDDKRPFPRQTPRESGVGLSAIGGETAVRRLAIDRDVFYYSGKEYERGEHYASMNAQGEIAVGDGAFFPMGDHATSSYDARSWGPAPLSLLKGRALAVFWPPRRIHRIPSP